MLQFPKKSKIEGFPVNDVETGAPLAFMAAKLLAKKDVAWGHEIYLNVKEKGIGQQLKVWDYHMS